MTMKRMVGTTVGAGYLLGFLLVAFTPGALAQGGEAPLVIEPDGAPTSGTATGRLVPETGTVEITYKFKVTVPGSVCVGKAITVTYEILEPPTQSVPTLGQASQTKEYTGRTQSGATPTDPYGGTATQTISGFETKVRVSFTQSAQAFKDYTITVQAKALGQKSTSTGCTVQDSVATKASIPIKADYFSLVQYAPKDIIQTTGQNKKVSFALDVTNFSNGQTRITAKVDGGKGLSTIAPPGEIVLPPSQLIDSKSQNKQTAVIQVLTPAKNGYTNKVYAFTVAFKAESYVFAVGLAPPVETTLPFSVKVQGVYVPGFDSASLIAALGLGLAFMGVVRRRNA